MGKSNHRLERGFGQSLRNWEKLKGPATRGMTPDAFVEMGWGRLVFGHTFADNARIVETMTQYGYDSRDIAMYIIDPHVVVSLAPEKLFLDPSHTFRLWSHDYTMDHRTRNPFVIQRVSTRQEAEAINRIYSLCRMKGADPDFILDKRANKLRTYMIAKDLAQDRVIGTVTGVDHVAAFNDPEKGASLWSLAVDPQSDFPGVGISLVRHLCEHYFTRGRAFVDISVMHNNKKAIALYEKLGCHRIPVFCIKRKNPINQDLYTTHQQYPKLNPYAKLIVDEAKQRGIRIDIVDEAFGLFTLTLGSKTISCRESLSDLTTAVAMTKCDDKRLTRKLLAKHNIRVPEQIMYTDLSTAGKFMEKYRAVVVKPARGEQGEGISVDISQKKDLETAIQKARDTCPDVIIEELAPGQDLRIIVINYEVVAAAVRRPPMIRGTGTHSIRELMEKYNRRRMAATGGESRIPMDAETKRTLAENNLDYDTILPEGKEVLVRKTANLHTGGTIHDVTDQLHPELVRAAKAAAQCLEIPVTGLDFMVPDVAGSEYVIIEANERPGLANHEPRPTAQRFVDLLFPETAVKYKE
ncbi:MAG: N-acetylglutaminylglutamine synthetase [Desulfotignum sp.]|jgi:GNAT-family acetyltransferase (TIGR03103 family)|nr:N-acetylglutaminylglutamine synthetase [Desulfotignum sp.]